MTLRKILTYPSAQLREKSEPVAEFGEDLTSLVQDMIDTLEVHSGAGLAAPQIGVRSRVLVIKPAAFGEENPDPDYGQDYWVLVNPSLSNPSSDERVWKEGCLSIPGVEGRVIRHESCTVTYQRVTGEEVSVDLAWPLSGALVHENDHLDGVLYVDRMKGLERDILLRRVAKRARREAHLARIQSDRRLLEQEGVQGLLTRRRKRNSTKKRKRKR